MSALADALESAIDDGRIGERVWLYSNYHCNLRCRYCLTESAPGVARRSLEAGEMVEVADQARALGFRALGVTGGEPFLIREMPELLGELARRLPVLVLSNATLFSEKLLARMRRLAGAPVTVQVSLDSAEPDVNDEMRAPHNFEKVVAAIPKLVDAGIPVRIATTGDHNTPAQMEGLCALHRSLGVPDADHVVRPIVRRGRALEGELGVVAEAKDLEPELTLTADGSFWSRFGPTVHVVARLRSPRLASAPSLEGPAGALPRSRTPRPRARHDSEHPLSVTSGRPVRATHMAGDSSRAVPAPRRSAGRPAPRRAAIRSPWTPAGASAGGDRRFHDAQPAAGRLDDHLHRPSVRGRPHVQPDQVPRRIARIGPRSVIGIPDAARSSREPQLPLADGPRARLVPGAGGPAIHDEVGEPLDDRRRELPQGRGRRPVAVGEDDHGPGRRGVGPGRHARP